MKIFLITTAGGSGTRMGAGKPKQFLELGGKSVLQLTLERLKEGIPDAELITVLPQDQISVWKQMCYDSRFSCRQTLVAGGITRFHSVKNALAKVPDGAIVAVHDGVRPLISPAFVRRLLDEALEFGSAVPLMPCVETMKLMYPKTLTPCGGYADRSRLFGIQTPQFFRSEMLKAAYRQPFDTAFTDDSSVAEAAGASLHYCPGERFNIKLATPDDMLLAEALLKLGQKV